ncbi:MAG TPA: thioredoxin domain-containing protein [Gaiellaceae bacterium]|nr:thioredoxin domain-containing protein [Gaiellaceae bacterium]
MTSGKKARRERRTPAPPPVRSTGGRGRQASPKVLAIGAGVIALAAVAVALAFALTGGSSSGSSATGTTASTLPDSGTAKSLFKGIPQHGNVLGKPNAPVTMVEYIDLQCPICREFETTVMPSIVPRYIRSGKVRLVARPIAFLGPDSVRGRLAALAAGKQNRFFDFSQLLYYNQGQENSGWLDDNFIRSAYASIPGLDAAAAEKARNASAVSQLAGEYDTQADADNVRGTPTVLVGKTGGKLTEVTSPDVANLSAAIQAAQAGQ